MPELPEVETIKNELAPHVVGRLIADIALNWEGVVRYPSPRELRSRLVGQRIARLDRRGKYLIFSLSGGWYLIIHLKMSGSLLVGDNPVDAPQWTRATFFLDDGTRIAFRDPRKFGGMWLVNDPAEVVGKLGPEPLQPGFTASVLAELLRGRKAPIKALLCDQELLAGVGNMYADEALFAAMIHPLRPGGSLSPDEVGRLHRAIIEVLRAGIQGKGASIVNYYRPSGEPGTAHDGFRVAHRGGEPCPRCGTLIERLVVRGRGTYYCPKCQPLR